MNLDTLPFVPCNHRSPRGGPVDLIVIHTNEGDEGPRSAEGLAAYLQHVDPGYNITVDENSAVRCAWDAEAVWGAGGVNHRAWHLCLTGWSAQTAAQWNDASSRGELAIAADLVRQAAAKLSVPVRRITDTRTGNRGICGHGDVSRYFSASMGHTDPGPNFPWDDFMRQVAGSTSPNIVVIPPSPPSEDIVYATYQDQLHGFYVTGPGGLFQRYEGKDGAIKELDLSKTLSLGKVSPTGLDVAEAPNGDLVVGFYGVDGVFNEARWAKAQGVWKHQVFR